MRVDFDKVIAQEDPRDPETRERKRDQEQLLPDAGTNDLSPPNANALRDAWIKHMEKHPDQPFYIIPGGGGEGGFEGGLLLRVGPDNAGKTVTALPYINTWKPAASATVFDASGPDDHGYVDPWDKLYSSINFNFIIPPWMKDETRFYGSYYNALASAWYVSDELKLCAKMFLNSKPPIERKAANLTDYQANLLTLLTAQGGMIAEDLLYKFVAEMSAAHREEAQGILEDFANNVGLSSVVEQLSWMEANHPEDDQTVQQLLSGQAVDLPALYPEE